MRFDLTAIAALTSFLIIGTSGAECEVSCEEEFPKCVNFKGCESCLEELQTAGSMLVNRGGCTVGCEPSMIMTDLCPTTTPPPPSPTAPSPTPPSPTPPTGGPTDMELCTSANRGDCWCGSNGVDTYIMYPDVFQRCLHTYLPPGASETNPAPVLISVSGYGTHGMSATSNIVKAAEYYGFAAMSIGATGQGDGAGGFGLEFPNGGVANPSVYKSCGAEDSREWAYIETVLDFIKNDPSLDESKVYLEGFSQNSMFAAYIAVCWADRIAGLWQGGSGLAKTFHTPIVPGKQAQCSFDAYDMNGNTCCETDFCNECTWWPLYPRTCEHKLVDCIAAYTNDNIACGSDWYMYEAMVAEGNDARLLSFPVPEGGGGGHQNPQNQYAWMTGCLGIVDSCSAECEVSFGQCVDDYVGSSSDAFAACEANISALGGCVAGCAPTLAMLSKSEEPVATLSEGKFGTASDLPAHSGTAPQPACQSAFGDFTVAPSNSCTPPEGSGAKAGIMEECPAIDGM